VFAAWASPRCWSFPNETERLCPLSSVVRRCVSRAEEVQPKVTRRERASQRRRRYVTRRRDRRDETRRTPSRWVVRTT
jgi:hypothetical protein